METRQANPTPPPGMKGGVEEGGRAGMEVGLIETQSTVNATVECTNAADHFFLITSLFVLMIYNIFTDPPCGLQGVADPRICTTHPYMLPSP